MKIFLKVWLAFDEKILHFSILFSAWDKTLQYRGFKKILKKTCFVFRYKNLRFLLWRQNKILFSQHLYLSIFLYCFYLSHPTTTCSPCQKYLRASSVSKFSWYWWLFCKYFNNWTQIFATAKYCVFWFEDAFEIQARTLFSWNFTLLFLVE